MLSRRTLILSGASALFLGATSLTPSAQAKPLRFLLKKSHEGALDSEARFRLTKATVDVLETHYRGMTLQHWAQPFEQIDFHKRITNIVYWINEAVQEHSKLHPVDPIWVVSQIMAESLFCEFAISDAMAAGICQFVPRTAVKQYGMLIAGSIPEHHQAPYLKTEFANAYEEYLQLVRDRNQYRKSTRDQGKITLKKALKWLAEGKQASQAAVEQMEREEKIIEYNERIRQAKKNYRIYIETNIQELGKNDIFNHTDFFTGFDERFTYKKPINAMVHMLANALRVRGGNILAATAAYNAGLSRTWTSAPLYTTYGTLPNFAETSQYVSKIVANYEEIATRYYS